MELTNERRQQIKWAVILALAILVLFALFSMIELPSIPMGD